MTPYLNVVQIIVSIALIGLTILQSKGGGGGMFGGDSAVQRTRRGVDKTIFRITIILAVVFLITSLLNVLVRS